MYFNVSINLGLITISTHTKKNTKLMKYKQRITITKRTEILDVVLNMDYLHLNQISLQFLRVLHRCDTDADADD